MVSEIDSCLNQIEQSFPETIEIIEEVKELCESAKEIIRAQKDINLTNNQLKTNEESNWKECERILNEINKIEKGKKMLQGIRTSSAATVTIGTRCGTLTNVSNVLNTMDMEELSKRITMQINQTNPTIKTPLSPMLIPNDVEIRQRSFTVSTCSNLDSKFNLIQLKAMETKEGERKRHLSLRLDKLVNDEPQEKLLQVLTKTNNRTRKISNPWKQYIETVSNESKTNQIQSKHSYSANDVLETNNTNIRSRKSIRYGDRNTMNMFLQKRKSKIATSLSKEEFQSLFQSQEDSTAQNNVDDDNKLRPLQKSAPRRVEFKRKQDRALPAKNPPILTRMNETPSKILDYETNENQTTKDDKLVVSPREKMLKTIAVKHKNLSQLNDKDSSSSSDNNSSNPPNSPTANTTSPKSSNVQENRGSLRGWLKEGRPRDFIYGTLRRKALDKDMKSRDKVKKKNLQILIHFY